MHRTKLFMRLDARFDAAKKIYSVGIIFPVGVEGCRMELNIIQEMQAQRFLTDCGWGLAGRDDSRLARAIVEGEAVDAVYTLEEEAALDDVLRYMELQGFVPMFEQLAACMRVERVNVPPIQYIWLYFVKLLLGIRGVAKMSPLLLRDESLMRRLGFNAHQIAHGVTRRGDTARGDTTAREGPVSSEAVAENIVKLSVLALATFFNRLMRRAVALVVEDDELDVVIDCSLYETTEKFKGAGRTCRERRVKSTDGQWVKVATTIFGWKVGVAYHPPTGLPLALCVTRINTDDRAHFWTLLDDVRKNLGDKQIRSVVMDRGFLDGEDLWRLNEQDIKFVIPARKDMRIYADAVAIAGRYGKDPNCPEVTTATWTETRTEGYGKDAKPKGRTTEVLGVPNLTTMETYGPPGYSAGQNRNDFKPNSIQAVVVRAWRGRTFKQPTVFITNESVQNPRKPFQLYDERSRIENGVFREGKQDWSLERPPQKSEAGVTVHVYLTLGAIALTRCYRLETEASQRAADRAAAQRQQADARAAAQRQRAVSKTSDLLSPLQLKLGMERYRLDLKVQNRNKVILFLDDIYGILHVQEMAMLSGVNLRERSPGVGNRDETLRKFGLITSLPSRDEPPPGGQDNRRSEKNRTNRTRHTP